MLHGAIFLFPVALATLSQPGDDATHDLARGWLAVFAIEILLYVVGTAFIVLILAKDRTMHAYKMAAATDPLTGLLNRRGFFEAAKSVMWRHRGHPTPIGVLVFDLDHFKSINDRFGHGAGDDMLRLFAGVVRQTIVRATSLDGSAERSSSRCCRELWPIPPGPPNACAWRSPQRASPPTVGTSRGRSVSASHVVRR
jgi:hypothetical protein